MHTARKEAYGYYLQIDISKIFKILYPQFADIPIMFQSGLNEFLPSFEGKSVHTLLWDILDELKSRRPYFETSTKGKLIQLTSELQRARIVPYLDELLKNSLYNKIIPAMLYIKNHFADKITPNDMCGELHIDKYYLCKLFKKLTGITIFQYIIRVILQNAEKLLTTTNKAITQIAYECGFSTIQYFNSVFTKVMGCLPSRYRNGNEKGSIV